LLLTAWAILRTRRDLSALTRALNVVAIVLVVIPLLQIAVFEGGSIAADRNEQKIAVAAPQVQISASQDTPDVYYMLLDGYPRQIYRQYLGQDTHFLASLEERGFSVPRCSQSNYSDTRFSMAATLNMNYLDKGTGEPEVLVRADELDELIQYSAVQKNFEDLGYQIVTFEPGFRWLNWRQPDYHLMPADENTARGLRFGLKDLNTCCSTPLAETAPGWGAVLQSNRCRTGGVHRNPATITGGCRIRPENPPKQQRNPQPQVCSPYRIAPHPLYIQRRGQAW
jgi:hypothetical protein